MIRRWHVISLLVLSFCSQKTKQAALSEPEEVTPKLTIPAEVPQDDPKSPVAEIVQAAAQAESREMGKLIEEMRATCRAGKNQEDPMGVTLCNVLLNETPSKIMAPALAAIPIALDKLAEAEEKVADAAKKDPTVCNHDQNEWAQACQPEGAASAEETSAEEEPAEAASHGQDAEHQKSHKLTRGQYFTALILGVVAVSIKEEFDSIVELGKAHYNMHTSQASESKIKYLKIQKWAGIGAMVFIGIVLLSGGAEHLIHIAHNPTSEDWRNLGIGFAAAATFSYVVGYYAYHNYYFEAAERGWVQDPTSAGTVLKKADGLTFLQRAHTSLDSMIRNSGKLLSGDTPLRPLDIKQHALDTTGHELEHAVKGEFKVGTAQFAIAAAFFGISMYVAREEKKKKEGGGLHLASQPTLSEALLPAYSKFIAVGQKFHRENMQSNPFEPLD